MAQSIVTWCDIHLSKGESITGESWVFTISPPGAKTVTFELDACEDCRRSFDLLVEQLGEFARQTAGPKTAKGSGAVSSSRGGPVAPCPLCEFVSANRSSLTDHLRRHHDTSQSELDGTAKAPCPVDGCGRKSVDARGVAAHVRTAHADWFAAHPDWSATTNPKSQARTAAKRAARKSGR